MKGACALSGEPVARAAYSGELDFQRGSSERIF